MEFHVGVALQKARDLVGLVRRQIVKHDVNLARPLLLAHQLGQECDKLSAGVPLRRFPVHPAGLHL